MLKNRIFSVVFIALLLCGCSLRDNKYDIYPTETGYEECEYICAYASSDSEDTDGKTYKHLSKVVHTQMDKSNKVSKTVDYICMYDKEGRKTTSSDGLTMYTYEYDYEGKLTSIKSYVDGIYAGQKLYEYDKEGGYLFTTAMSEDGCPLSSETKTYDESGNTVLLEYHDLADKTGGNDYNVFYYTHSEYKKHTSLVYSDGRGQLIEETRLNSLSQVSETVSYDDAGNIKSCDAYEYNDAGEVAVQLHADIHLESSSGVISAYIFDRPSDIDEASILKNLDIDPGNVGIDNITILLFSDFSDGSPDTVSVYDINQTFLYEYTIRKDINGRVVSIKKTDFVNKTEFEVYIFRDIKGNITKTEKYDNLGKMVDRYEYYYSVIDGASVDVFDIDIKDFISEMQLD